MKGRCRQCGKILSDATCSRSAALEFASGYSASAVAAIGEGGWPRPELTLFNTIAKRHMLAHAKLEARHHRRAA